MWDFATHDLSMILALTQEEPQSVNVQGSYTFDSHTIDTGSLWLSFASGIKAHIFNSWAHPLKEQRLSVVGEKGMLVFEDVQPWESKLILYPYRIEQVKKHLQPQGEAPVPIAVEPAEPLKCECQHFLDCIATGKRPISDHTEGLQIIKILQKAQQDLDFEAQPYPIAVNS